MSIIIICQWQFKLHISGTCHRVSKGHFRIICRSTLIDSKQTVQHLKVNFTPKFQYEATNSTDCLKYRCDPGLEQGNCTWYPRNETKCFSDSERGCEYEERPNSSICFIKVILSSNQWHYWSRREQEQARQESPSIRFMILATLCFTKDNLPSR